MKLKREIFSRPNRMVHGFDEQLNRDPFFGRSDTFEAPAPVGISGISGRSKRLNVQQYGLHEYSQPRSPVIKPNGRQASINGPAPDYASDFAVPIPSSSKKRRTP